MKTILISGGNGKFSNALIRVNKRYSKKNNCGFAWNDKNFNINWKIKKPILSDKDRFLKRYKVN